MPKYEELKAFRKQNLIPEYNDSSSEKTMLHREARALAISRLEERNAQIDHELTLEEVYSSSVKCQELAQEKSENEARLEELYERWAELEI